MFPYENRQKFSICEREKHVEKPSRRLTLPETLMIGLAAVVYILGFVFAVSCTDTIYDSQSGYASFDFIPSELPDAAAVNDADMDELIKINGIGEKRAELIIDFREAIGGFTDIRQIMYLDGIGEKLFSNILDHFYPGYRLENGSIVRSQ